MKKLLLKTILNSVTIFSIVLVCSCSRSVVISQRPITDFAGLEKKIVKSCSLRSSSNTRIKFQTSVEVDGKNHSLNGRIFLLSDTCVFISVMSPSIGIEVGRMIANKDSVFVVNKIDKTYFSSDYKTNKNIYGLNFRLLYSIFSASYLNCDSVLFSNSNTEFIADMGCFVVSKVYKTDSLKSFSTTFFDGFGNIIRSEYKSANSDFLRANYSNFALKDGFPTKMNVTVGFGGKKREVEIEIKEVTQLKKDNFPNMRTDIRKFKRINL